MTRRRGGHHAGRLMFIGRTSLAKPGTPRIRKHDIFADTDTNRPIAGLRVIGGTVIMTLYHGQSTVVGRDYC
jgi:hypothetical protein